MDAINPGPVLSLHLWGDRDKKRAHVHFTSVEEVCGLSGSAQNSLSAHTRRSGATGYTAQHCGFGEKDKQRRITKRHDFMWSRNCLEMGSLMEKLMRHLVLVLTNEVTYLVRECVKWSLVCVVLFLCMWFLTDGLPRVVAVINGLTFTHVSQSGTAQLDAPRNLTHSR